MDLLVNSMPALHDLCVGELARNIRLPGLLERAHWPSLERFTMGFHFTDEGASEADAAVILADFLKKHPTIKYFYALVPLPPGSIPPTAVFTSLAFRPGYSNGTPIPVVYIIPHQTLRHIHSLQIVDELLDSESISMLRHMPCLRYLTMINKQDLPRIVQLAPKLERLRVYFGDGEVNSMFPYPCEV